MSEHRFILQPYKGVNTRYHCPACQARGKTFALYIDTETGQILGNHVGRCDRESNCGYHYSPKQFFIDNDIDLNQGVHVHKIMNTMNTVNTLNKSVRSLIPIERFRDSLNGYEQNNFVTFLVKSFGSVIAEQLISKYFIGTSNHWPGSTIFWQIDQAGKIRTGKVMLYSPDTGKRVKTPYNHITWVHKSVDENYNLQQCFFGEHLLKDKSKTVGILESEKSALIASVYFPQFIWLAAGSLNNLNENKFKVLSGRNVILFPDLNAFDKWKEKADLSSGIANIKVSDLLEKSATETERLQGLDLADYLLRFSPEREPEPAKDISEEDSGGSPQNWRIPYEKLEWKVDGESVNYRYDPDGFYTAKEREILIMWQCRYVNIKDVPFNMLPTLLQQKYHFLKPSLN